MSSLKGFIPGLARHLAISPLALYERQRALVRAGLLAAPQERRRGLGGGIQATAPSVALLLVAVLATDNLSETEERAAAVAAGEIQSRKLPFSHLPKFKDALAAVVLQEGLCRQVEEVRVSRTTGRATVRFKASSRFGTAEFGFARIGAGIQVEASIGAEILRRICADLSAIIEATVGDAQ